MAAQPIDNHLLARILSEEPNLDWESFSPEDWTMLVERSQATGIAPLVHWALSKSGRISLVPKIERNFLRAAYVSTWMNNRQILMELQELNRLFRQADIPVVALKGICYALTIYPDIGLRPMVDLDLLVPRSRLPEALQIAHDLGYEKARPEAISGLDELLNHAACLAKTRSPFSRLEIHHTLVGEDAFRYAVPVDWFWTQTERLQGSSAEWEADNLLMLTPTAQLLYACAHAMLQHGGRNASLGWMYDLDQLVRLYSEQLDWNLLVAQASKFEWSSAVSAALSEIVSIFLTPVPAPVLGELAVQVDRNMERVLEMQSLPDTHTLEEYQRFKALDGKGRLKLFLGLAIPDSAYMRWRYGLKTNSMLPLWYLYRWLGIIKDGGRTALHLLHHAI